MLTEIISNITGAFTQLMTSMTEAFGTGFQNLVVDADGALTPLAEWGLVFIGVGLAVGLVYLVINLVRK